MRNLIRAALVRYTKDIFTLLAMICALAVSIMMTMDSRVQSDSGYERWIMMPEGFFSPGIIFALIAVILSVGREFSDKTIRNKMIVGCTRTQIIGAEMIAAMLICHRTYSIIAVAGVMIALVLCSHKLTFHIVQGSREFDTVTEYTYSTDENGDEIRIPVEKQVPNPLYIPEKQRALLTHINNTNPATGLSNVIEFFALTMYIDETETQDVTPDYRQLILSFVEEKSRPLGSTLALECGLVAVLFACGLLCFQRRDVK